jgi:hypothetical protein
MARSAYLPRLTTSRRTEAIPTEVAAEKTIRAAVSRA